VLRTRNVATASLPLPNSNHTGTHHAVSEELLDVLSPPIPFASRAGEITSASTTPGACRLAPQRVSELPCRCPCPRSLLWPECDELYSRRKRARDSSWTPQPTTYCSRASFRLNTSSDSELLVTPPALEPSRGTLPRQTVCLDRTTLTQQAVLRRPAVPSAASTEALALHADT
jgi:hypothetical protein